MGKSLTESQMPFKAVCSPAPKKKQLPCPYRNTDILPICRQRLHFSPARQMWHTSGTGHCLLRRLPDSTVPLRYAIPQDIRM